MLDTPISKNIHEITFYYTYTNKKKTFLRVTCTTGCHIENINSNITTVVNYL